MEWEYNGVTYWLDWYAHDEVYLLDEDGNDVTDDVVYRAACDEVWDYYVGQAEMRHDMMMGR